MILADKIIQERKKNGWSQEELAEKLGVTRQAVSKWEGAQTTPDLDRLLKMSHLFGVTMDYLIKDEVEVIEYTQSAEEEGSTASIRKVSMEEANEFLRLKRETAPKIAIGVALCIISPAILFLLTVSSELNMISLSEEISTGIGVISLLGIVAMACAIFIFYGMKTKDYEFLEKEAIETEYGVTGMVKERKQQFSSTYIKYNILGVISCFIGVMTLLSSVFFGDDEFITILFLCFMLIILAVGVGLFIIAGTINGSYDMLLQEGEFSIEEKKRTPVVAAASTIYWLIILALFLAMIFLNDRAYESAGLIWPIAGVIYPIVVIIVKMFQKKNKAE